METTNRALPDTPTASASVDLQNSGQPLPPQETPQAATATAQQNEAPSEAIPEITTNPPSITTSAELETSESAELQKLDPDAIQVEELIASEIDEKSDTETISDGDS